ncbi:MAG: Asp-tRNA(Asn)/Glu-tRNA(Gln) amidotransferase subunit GatB [Candidatus Pacearchaeota archaeon]
MVKGKRSEELKGKIGLEIHSYILTKEKLFCRCLASRERGLKPNTLVCPICTGQPGAKPMLPNEEAVKKAVQIGLMLGCEINKKMKWQRKHYDWPDLPKGYQNTISGTYASPVGVKGKFHNIGIWSMHLEEDPASWTPETGCIDYNRSGLPLVEIITAPDFETSSQVVEWLKKLLHNLDYLKAIDSNAGIKVDINVNLENVTFSSPTIAKQRAIAGMPGKTARVEIKNVNSLENVGKAIDYELKRQMSEGGTTKETRRFDELKGKTMKMRSKEEAEDYRFITEPDLREIIIDDKFISAIEKEIPEAPEEKLSKMMKKFKIDKKNAEILTKNIDIAEFFEKVAEKIDAKFALPWVTIELLRLLNDNKTRLSAVDIKVEHFVELLKNVKEGKITALQGKQILKKFYPKSFSISEMSAKGKIEGKITDKKELEKIASEVVKKNPKAVSDYKSGEQKAFEFLMGEIMKATNKRADFKIARDVLERLLKKI